MDDVKLSIINYQSLFNVSALVAGELVAVVGVDNHHAVTFRHFAREFPGHHFAVSLFFFHEPNYRKSILHAPHSKRETL